VSFFLFVLGVSNPICRPIWQKCIIFDKTTDKVIPNYRNIEKINEISLDCERWHHKLSPNLEWHFAPSAPQVRNPRWRPKWRPSSDDALLWRIHQIHLLQSIK
jgi:hypothetical protein